MSRAQFDREQVIGAATQLFWQRGFSGASMQQVVKATGLQPGSIYLAFGSKEGLYQAALAFYAEQTMAKVRTTLDAADSAGSGICQILRQLVSDSRNSDYCSCFLVKSELELAASGSELWRVASTYLGQIEELYLEYLEREHPPAQARHYAASLVMQIYGLRVYGYLQRPQALMLAALEHGLPWLPWSSVQR